MYLCMYVSIYVASDLQVMSVCIVALMFVPVRLFVCLFVGLFVYNMFVCFVYVFVYLDCLRFAFLHATFCDVL